MDCWANRLDVRAEPPGFAGIPGTGSSATADTCRGPVQELSRALPPGREPVSCTSDLSPHNLLSSESPQIYRMGVTRRVMRETLEKVTVMVVW